MLILSLDTSAAHCAVALLLDGRVVGERFEPMTKGQAESLMPLAEDVIADGGYAWADLDAIGVGVGPGNFTGIRIAVSAARGLALSLKIKAIGVTATEAQAYGIKGLCVSSLDARQDKLYVDALNPHDSHEIVLCDLETLPKIPSGVDVSCVGHNADEIAKRCSGTALSPKFSIATAIGHIAAERFHTNIGRPAPHYVRAPDAALPRDTAPDILDA